MKTATTNRRAMLPIVAPLLDVIEKRRTELAQNVLNAYEATGFQNPNHYLDEDDSPDATAARDAWEILPHQYVWSKLYAPDEDELLEKLERAIEQGIIQEIAKNLIAFVKLMTQVFSEVEEFLSGPLSRMKKDEWESTPLWGDKVNAAAIGDLPNWKIGVVSMFENQIRPGTLEEIEAENKVIEKALFAACSATKRSKKKRGIEWNS
jgi:hypothetical protein